MPSCPTCGFPARARFSTVQAAFQAAAGLWPFTARSGAGNRARQSCLQPSFRRLANPEHWRSQRFFGFVSCRYRDGKPEKFVKGRASRLQPGLAAPQKSQSREAAFQAGVERTSHAVRSYLSVFVFAGIPQRSLRNSSPIGNGGLKGRLQARLPATRAKRQAPYLKA
jgi:hypothetical protein